MFFFCIPSDCREVSITLVQYLVDVSKSRGRCGWTRRFGQQSIPGHIPCRFAPGHARCETDTDNLVPEAGKLYGAVELMQDGRYCGDGISVVVHQGR